MQDKQGVISIPKSLQGFMGGKTVIGRQKKVPELNPIALAIITTVTTARVVAIVGIIIVTVPFGSPTIIEV
ncbi:hypothetical protein NQ317_002749 [Molorchus minor]|uniref:Uncharacterized protein n=1 Tax=Molorchus minor TaxID=1323400 RepID=A0ABQ9K4W9_9CUCU|nr:hypothetical protein NQ317_002749 [Molorchus minor]